jgi:4-cresol dehydrogenase (hydroxylating) flavoprotein subunit
MSRQSEISPTNLERAIADFTRTLGQEAVLTSPEDVRAHRDPYAFKGSDAHDAAAVVMPASADEVQAMVKIAGRHGVPLWTFGHGRNYAYGGPAPVLKGSVLVNLRRMSRVLEVNHDLAYAVIEPGVRWFDLHDALGATGRRLWHSTPDLGWGSVIGNTLEYGRGYTPHGDHAANVFGLEVVLPDGELLRTGMGAMASSKAWHVYPHGYGPSVDRLFMQSNLGIVTKMGVGLLPRPEAYACGWMKFNGDDRLTAVIDTLRGLMLEGTLVNYPLMRCGYAEAGEPIMDRSSDEWRLRFGLYGRREIVEANLRIVERAFSPTGVELQTRIFAGDDDLRTEDHDVKVQGGVPGLALLDIFKIPFGEDTGHLDLSPVVPMIGSEVRGFVRLQRSLCEAHGYPYLGVFLVAPRSAIHIGTTFYDTRDEAMTRAAHDAYARMVVELARAGYPIYRANIEHMDLVAGQFDFGDHAMRRFQETLKDAVDPRGVLSPGKQGVWPRSLRRGRDTWE